MSTFWLTVLTSLTASLIFYFIELALDSSLGVSKKQEKKFKLIRKRLGWLSSPIKRVRYTILFGLSYWIDKINKHKYIIKIHHNEQTHKRMWTLQNKYNQGIIMEGMGFDTIYECKNRLRADLKIKRLYLIHKEDNSAFYAVYVSDKNFGKNIKKGINTLSITMIRDAKDNE